MSELHRNDKLCSNRGKIHSSVYILDKDLQIQLPVEASNPDAVLALTSILPANKNELASAMEEAKTSFQTMMEIHKQLLIAYQEFLQMRK